MVGALGSLKGSFKGATVGGLVQGLGVYGRVWGAWVQGSDPIRGSEGIWVQGLQASWVLAFWVVCGEVCALKCGFGCIIRM